MAAWTLIQSGNTAKGERMLLDLVKKHSPATLLVLNIIDWSKSDITPYRAAMTALPAKGSFLIDYEQRMVEYFRGVDQKRKK